MRVGAARVSAPEILSFIYMWLLSFICGFKPKSVCVAGSMVMVFVISTKDPKASICVRCAFELECDSDSPPVDELAEEELAALAKPSRSGAVAAARDVHRIAWPSLPLDQVKVLARSAKLMPIAGKRR